MKLHFLGATRQVTGSQYCLHTGGAKVVIDCGMYQERKYLDRNWDPSPLPLGAIDAVLVTHAHLDHCGLLPKLIREGYRGPIYATSASADLVELVLRDSAEIQAEDIAQKRKRHRKEGRKGTHPEVVLYTVAEAQRVRGRIQEVAYGQTIRLGGDVDAVFHDAGHILGSSMVELTAPQNGRPQRIIFSGDIGQWDKPILRDPSVFAEADIVVMESTYGHRDHEDHGGVEAQLARVINSTVEAGGNVVIPSFAIERAQELMYYINRLMRGGHIPRLPVFLDSPMAADVTEVFRRHRECFDAEAWQRIAAGESLLRFPELTLVRTAEDSKEINRLREPTIIMATSGMCTAGRIKHHLTHNIMRPECTILFAGYQAQGTLGRQILDGNPQVRILGRQWLVRARVEQIHGCSGHADHKTLLRWLDHFRTPPRRLFLTHGDEESSLALAGEIGRRPGWNVLVPRYRETVGLD